MVGGSFVFVCSKASEIGRESMWDVPGGVCDFILNYLTEKLAEFFNTYQNETPLLAQPREESSGVDWLTCTGFARPASC